MPNEEAPAVNETVEQAPTTTESAPVETKELEVVTEGPAVNPKDVQEVEESEVEEPAKPTETKVTDKQEPEELAPKSANRFQQLANQNRELRQQLEQLQARQAQVANEQNLLDQVNPETGDYYTPQEVERIARFEANKAENERLSQQQQQLQVQMNQQTLATEADQALRDFAMFDADNKDAYKQELASLADDLLGDALFMDDQQNVLGSKVSPHKLYKTVATAYEQGVRDGQLKGQKATQQMLSQVDSPSSAPVKRTPAEEAYMSPGDYAKAKGLEVVW